MPLFNVDVSVNYTMVVEAEDGLDAVEVAHSYWKDAMDETSPFTVMHVTGEVITEQDLKGDWNSDCVAYGSEGMTRIEDILKEP